MSEKIMVKCSCGNHFLVNLAKHQDRDYVMCSRCHAEIKVRKGPLNWKPSLSWHKQKDHRKATVQQMKVMRKKQESMPVAPAGEDMVRAALAALYLESQRSKKEEKQHE